MNREAYFSPCVNRVKWGLCYSYVYLCVILNEVKNLSINGVQTTDSGKILRAVPSG